MTGANPLSWRSGGRISIILGSLIAIVVINALAAQIMSNRISERIIAREAQETQATINRLFRLQNPGENLFKPPHPSPALTEFAQHVGDLPDLIRSNIYSPDRFIRFSSQPGLIGVRFEESNPELDSAFAGEVSATLETVDGESKEEQTALPLKPGEPFIEAYLPVSGEDGKVVAVVELYKRSVGAEAVISGLQWFIWLTAALSGLVLFFAFNAMFVWGAGHNKTAA